MRRQSLPPRPRPPTLPGDRGPPPSDIRRYNRCSGPWCGQTRSCHRSPGARPCQPLWTRTSRRALFNSLETHHRRPLASREVSPGGAGDRRKFSNRRGGGVSKKSSTLLDTAGAKGNAGRSEPTTFNLALLLQRNNKHAEAVEYWRRYLANDAQSEWAARARRSLKILRNATATLLIAAVFQVAACNALPRPWRGSQRVFLRSGLGLGAGQENTRAGFPGFPDASQQRWRGST